MPVINKCIIVHARNFKDQFLFLSSTCTHLEAFIRFFNFRQQKTHVCRVHVIVTQVSSMFWKEKLSLNPSEH